MKMEWGHRDEREGGWGGWVVGVDVCVAERDDVIALVLQ
jgi:hypothetical protein